MDCLSATLGGDEKNMHGGSSMGIDSKNATALEELELKESVQEKAPENASPRMRKPSLRVRPLFTIDQLQEVCPFVTLLWNPKVIKEAIAAQKFEELKEAMNEE